MTMYHSAFEKQEWETGFSAVTPKTLYGGNGTERVVEVIRLATWIQDEIQNRLIPERHAKDHTDPTVVMKLDIEGLEFKVFPDLLTTGALCNNIHFLMGEFHYSPGNWNYFPITLTSDGKHVLAGRKQGELLAKELLHIHGISETCMTKISLDDDESYLTDPHPYPTSSDETTTTVHNSPQTSAATDIKPTSTLNPIKWWPKLNGTMMNCVHSEEYPDDAKGALFDSEVACCAKYCAGGSES